MNPLENNTLNDLLHLKNDGSVYHRESKTLEFKEQFNKAGLAEYLRDFAAFANSSGGYLVFGITDSPRNLQGLSSKSLQSFEELDPERVSGFLNEIFSSEINWEQCTFKKSRKTFGIFYIQEAQEKPIIAKKNEGKDQSIRNGEIYYRYAGRTQVIQYAELNSMIGKKIEAQNTNWLNLMRKIASVGPSNAAILDTEKGVIEKNKNSVIVIDRDLIPKIQFLKEGNFKERDGASALRLIGDVQPIDTVEVVKIQKTNLLEQYPFSGRELLREVKKKFPKARQDMVWRVIRENGLKENSDYSAYSYRNKTHEEKHKRGEISSKSISSIYNQNAVDYVVKVLKNDDERR